MADDGGTNVDGASSVDTGAPKETNLPGTPSEISKAGSGSEDQNRSRAASQLSSFSGESDPSFHVADEEEGNSGDDIENVDDGNALDDDGKSDADIEDDTGEQGDDEGNDSSAETKAKVGARRPLGLGRGRLMVDRTKARKPTGAVFMVEDPIEKQKAQRKRELMEKRAKAKRDRAEKLRRERLAQQRLIERQARRIRTPANLWGLAAGSSWDTSESDEVKSHLSALFLFFFSRRGASRHCS